MATIFFLYGGGQISSFSPVVTFCKEKCLTGKIYFPNWKNLFSQLESAKKPVGRFLAPNGHPDPLRARKILPFVR